MPPAKKSETKKIVPTPVAAPAPAAAPAAEKKARKAPAAKAEVVVPTVAAPAVPAVAEAAPAETRGVEAILTDLQSRVRALQTAVLASTRTLLADVVATSKAVKREARESKRKVKVDPATLSPEARAAWEARRANNAFLRQRPISDELAVFMGTTAGSKRSQTEVTKFIADYVKSHGCFDKDFKRRILPNAALATLLRVSDKDEVTYLNLQSFLKVHFKKE
jgi:chromatin remodeling complex protein RSC6